MTKSETTTRGVTVSVQPEFNEENSNAEAGVYVYTYTITITNNGNDTVQLVSRHWIITDGFNKVENVKGPGVVGNQPILKPGDSFTYTSFCPLSTPSGSMKGTFQMKGEKGNFDAVIGEFRLQHKSLVN
jgi:ApaG protein